MRVFGLFRQQEPQASAERGSLDPSALRIAIPSAHFAKPLSGEKPFAVFDLLLRYGEREWSVHHRFSEFKVLADVIGERYSASKRNLPPLPGQNLLMHSMSRELVEQRRGALAEYLTKLVRVVPLSDDCLSAFLGLETLHTADDSALTSTPCVPAPAVSERTPGEPEQPNDSVRASKPDDGRAEGSSDAVADHAQLRAQPHAEHHAATLVASSPRRPRMSEPAALLRTSEVRAEQPEPLPFSWELLWEGAIGGAA